MEARSACGLIRVKIAVNYYFLAVFQTWLKIAISSFLHIPISVIREIKCQILS